MKHVNAKRVVVPVESWPERDRTLWTTGCAGGDPFEAAGYADRLRPDTMKKAAKGYGAWIGFLRDQGQLDPSVHPVDRITLPRLGQWLAAMEARGNMSGTIFGRFADLRRVLRIMAPDRETGFILRPNGVTLRSLLPKSQRGIDVLDSSVLLAWGHDLMSAGIAGADDSLSSFALRDGLIIAILASRARRLRAVSGLRLGTELQRHGERYGITFRADRIKAKRPDRFLLPQSLTAPIDLYLSDLRPRLMRGIAHDAVWVGRDDTPLTSRGFTSVIERRSLYKFGRIFRTHCFRHTIVSSIATQLPQHPGLAATVIMSPAT